MEIVSMLNWNCWYNRFQVLKGINLGFRNRSITAIVGPSGCGKTTLLRSINRTAELVKGFHYQGEIRVVDHNIYNHQPVEEVRKKIGLVYQTPVAQPLSIGENILFGPRYYEERDKEKLNNILETCLRKAALWDEVKDKLNKPAEQLSGGQKQRLSIARALAINPQVLLLDEPCSSLDPNSTQLIEELLINLSERLPIIIVTHNLFQARRIAQDIVFMLNGEVVEAGSSELMFSSPQQIQTRNFFSGMIG